MDRRVVVTGLGAVSPCGLDVPTTWDAVAAGVSGIGPITHFDASALPVTIAGEATGFDIGPLADVREQKRLDRFTQFAIVAAREALVQAGLDPDARLGERAGVYIGSGIGGIVSIEDQAAELRDGGVRRVSPFFIVRALANLAAGHVAIRHGCEGPSLAVSTACATGNHAIGEAAWAIRRGDADLVIAGGAEAPIGALGTAGFAMMRALSRRNDDPATASRPFDSGRDGFVMGEGAGIVVLESLDHARAREATPLAELVGYALTTDAFHVTAPPDDHAGAQRCMRLALRNAGLAPDAVDYVNAHGTSTPANDPAEIAALRAVFGAHADRLLVSSTKGATGHLLGAAGGLEAVLSVLALVHGLAPPTANLVDVDPACALPGLLDRAASADLRVVLSNAFGFGGTNAALLLRRFDG